MLRRPADFAVLVQRLGNVRRRNATAMERSCNESCVLRLIDRREVNSAIRAIRPQRNEYSKLAWVPGRRTASADLLICVKNPFRLGELRRAPSKKILVRFRHPTTPRQPRRVQSRHFLITQRRPSACAHLLGEIGWVRTGKTAWGGMGIFSRAQRYEQMFRLRSESGAGRGFSAFCFGFGAVSACSSMPAHYLGLPGRLESGLPLTLRQ